VAKTIANLVLVLLVAGVIIGASYALKPPASDVGQKAAFLVARAVKRPAAPGGAEALSQVIGGLQRGQTDLSRMNAKLAGAMRRGQTGAQRWLAGQGPLQSLTYLGGMSRTDLYRANFAKGPQLWSIGLDKNGTIQGLQYFPSSPPTQQDVIDNYAQFPWPERTTRMATQLGIMLSAALFGRLALRLRL
jgi:hypothetical protein